MSLLVLTALAQLVAPTSEPLPFPLELVAEQTLTSVDGLSATTQLFDLNSQILEELEALTSATLLHCPLPGGELVTLDLTRLPITTEPTQLMVNGIPTDRSVGEGITLWSGQVQGLAGSDVFFAFSEAGTRGWLRIEGEVPTLIHWIAEPGPSGTWDDSRVRMIDQDLLGLPPAPNCQIDSLPGGGVLTQAPFVPAQTPFVPSPRAATQSDPGQIAAHSSLLRNLPIAVETDYQFYQLFGSLPAAEAYAISLMGAVSARYREQLGLVITLPYLGLYSSPNDPWFSQDQGGGSLDVLYEMQGAWSPNMPAEAALGHLLSGASLGGGIAWLDVLCRPEFRFGVSGNLAGQTPFPAVQGPLNWDFIVVSHEIGHNLGTHHTHNYCPPIDECAPSGYFGPCQTGENCIVNGTLMSYCHLCPAGIANITPYFHPIVVQAVEARVANSCLLPFEGVFNKPLAGGLIGSSGLPKISPTYNESTHELSLSFTDLPMPGTGFLVASTVAINLPLLGGTLVPNTNIFVSFPVNASATTLPPVKFENLFLPAGISFYIQGWFTDPFSPSSFAATDAVLTEIIVPNPPLALTWFSHPTNGKQYAATPPGTWHKTEGFATEHGGHLVSIADAAEQAWLKATFFDSGIIQTNAYIGYTDEDFEGFYQWSSGAFLTFQNWGSGQPDEAGDGEDYTVWNGSSWNDVSGYEDLQGLIQKP